MCCEIMYVLSTISEHNVRHITKNAQLLIMMLQEMTPNLFVWNCPSNISGENFASVISSERQDFFGDKKGKRLYSDRHRRKEGRNGMREGEMIKIKNFPPLKITSTFLLTHAIQKISLPVMKSFQLSFLARKGNSQFLRKWFQSLQSLQG